MKKIGILLVASTLVLSACGKRDEGTIAGVSGFDADGNPTDGSTPTLGLAIGEELRIRVNSIPPSLNTGGIETAEVVAVITNEDNLPMADIPVSFSSTGGVLLGAAAQTDANGEASVQLSLQHDPANQNISVRVVAGNDAGEARVVATGSTLEVTGDDNVVLGNDVEITARLTAGSGDPLANEVITISSQAGNTLSASSAITDPDGLVSVTVGSANGNDTLSFSALNNGGGVATVSEQYQMTVSDDQLKFAADSATELAVNQAHEFAVNWSFNGSPIANRNLKFTITAGQVVGNSIVSTDANGDATVSVLSSIAGEVVLYAEALDGSVVNRHTFDFVGVSPDAISISSTSSRITTRDNATISVDVYDANGNPVKDTTVTFSSANLKGGQISSTSAITNVDGQADITFTAGSNATEEDEITIFAEIEGTAINSGVSLTVVEPALNVTIGSSNRYSLDNNETQYSVPYVVQVADGSGQALAGAKVQLSYFTEQYYKGLAVNVDALGRTSEQVPATEVFSANRWGAIFVDVCANEDTNGNRILDAGEDINGNGSLDPQDPALIVATSEDLGLSTLDANGVLTTDASGSGYFELVYPTSNAWWSRIRITARAQGLGVESEAHFTSDLGARANEIDDENSEPPFRFSPYGTQVGCINTL